MGECELIELSVEYCIENHKETSRETLLPDMYLVRLISDYLLLRPGLLRPKLIHVLFALNIAPN